MSTNRVIMGNGSRLRNGWRLEESDEQTIDGFDQVYEQINVFPCQLWTEVSEHTDYVLIGFGESCDMDSRVWNELLFSSFVTGRLVSRELE